MPDEAAPVCDLLADEARRAVLAKAAEARRVRAELAQRLSAGSLTLAELLDEIGGETGDETLGGTKVLAVLEELPDVGKVRARRTMGGIGIAKNCRLADLGDTERAELIAAFG